MKALMVPITNAKHIIKIFTTIFKHIKNVDPFRTQTDSFPS